jgi:dynein heavy chain
MTLWKIGLKRTFRILLVDLLNDSSFIVSDLVEMQLPTTPLKGKNEEIENAKDFEMLQEQVLKSDADKLRDHYNLYMYQAFLHSAKSSMKALKKRIGSRGGTYILSSSNPFFYVDVQLMPPKVSLSPVLNNIQTCINSTAKAVLTCYR